MSLSEATFLDVSRWEIGCIEKNIAENEVLAEAGEKLLWGRLEKWKKKISDAQIGCGAPYRWLQPICVAWIGTHTVAAPLLNHGRSFGCRTSSPSFPSRWIRWCARCASASRSYFCPIRPRQVIADGVWLLTVVCPSATAPRSACSPKIHTRVKSS